MAMGVPAGGAVGAGMAVAAQEATNPEGEMVDGDNAKVKFQKKGRDNSLALI